MALDWAKGLRRIFVLLCVAWAFIVLVWYPIRIAKQNREKADEFERLPAPVVVEEVTTPTPEDLARQAKETARHEHIAAGFWERATLPWIYKNEYLRHWPLVLGAMLLPPALFYGLAVAAFRTGRWVLRGFKAG